MTPSDADLAPWIGKGYRDVKAFHYAGSTMQVDWRIQYLDGSTALLVLPGTETPTQWLLDFLAVPVHAHPVTWTHDLGCVHAGFYAGLSQVWSVLKPLFEGCSIYIAGHSLGAARAAILTGIMVLDGATPARVLLCGAPQPGYARLAEVVKLVPCVTYWNTPARPTIEDPPDPVNDVPFYWPPLFPYQHAWSKITAIDVPPPIGDPWSFVGRHHDTLYEQGILQRSLK